MRVIGDTLRQVAKHVLQGPSAALQAPGFHRGRQGNAVLINLTSVTRSLLAYLAVQVTIALMLPSEITDIIIS